MSVTIASPSISTLGAALRKYGPVNCRACGKRSAKPEMSENPFDSNDWRVVYRCHGKQDFRVIDSMDIRRGNLGELFDFLVAPVFDPPMPVTWGDAAPKMSAGARRERRAAR